MKKILSVICVLCLVFIGWQLISLNKKLDAVQANCYQIQERHDSLSERLREYDAQSVALTTEELIVLQRNLEVLNAFYTQPYYDPIVLARECHLLKRSGKMESSQISSVQFHTTPEHWTEIITDDGEHYWFCFSSSSGERISGIYKGANKETILYAEIS